MTIITPGDADGAPYRRLQALRNIAGIAYESPSRKVIQTRLADIAGDGMYAPQAISILKQLQQKRLARFTIPDASLGHKAFGEQVAITNLNRSLLNRLTKETEDFINKRDNPPTPKPKPVAPAKKPKTVYRSTNAPGVSISKSRFGERHSIIRDTYVGVAVGIILLVISAVWPTSRNYIEQHIFHHHTQTQKTTSKQTRK